MFQNFLTRAKNIARPILQLLSITAFPIMHSGTCNPRDNARRTEKIKNVDDLATLHSCLRLQGTVVLISRQENRCQRTDSGQRTAGWPAIGRPENNFKT